MFNKLTFTVTVVWDLKEFSLVVAFHCTFLVGGQKHSSSKLSEMQHHFWLQCPNFTALIGSQTFWIAGSSLQILTLLHLDLKTWKSAVEKSSETELQVGSSGKIWSVDLCSTEVLDSMLTADSSCLYWSVLDCCEVCRLSIKHLFTAGVHVWG